MQADHPLTRQEVIERYHCFVQDFRLEAGRVWLGGGSALIIHDLRDTTMDLDGGCDDLTMSVVQRHHGEPPVRKTVEDGFLQDCQLLTLTKYDMDLHTEPNVRAEDLVVIEGVYVYSLEACLRQKRLLLERLGREKDQKDIDAILAAMGGSE